MSKDIYCEGGEGSILYAVQMSNICNDSKTFVDMKMKFDPEIVISNWEKFCKTSKGFAKDEVKDFVDKNFDVESEELEKWSPEDWSESPAFNVINLEAKTFCESLNKMWKLLGRKISEKVRLQQNRFSLIYLPNPFIVPGGRFREVYYWDSYWIIRGLLLSGMKKTARGMIDNLFHLIENIGYVPNGGRIYYTRSQPPLLSMMVESFLLTTDDKKWAESKLPLLVKEWKYWEETHSVLVSGKKMFRYFSMDDTPRPESYREDVNLAKNVEAAKKSHLWRELRSAAESGWDFSSRWFTHVSGSLVDTCVTNVAPVDLNAFLAKSANVIASLYQEMGLDEEAESWMKEQEQLNDAIESLMWDIKDGIWYDIDIDSGLKRRRFNGSNFVPLWTKSFSPDMIEFKASSCLNYLQKTLGVDNNSLATTLIVSGEQWDMPNAWPPLEHMLIMGLYNSGLKQAMEEARRLSKARVEKCHEIYNKTGHMFEKYNYKTNEEGGGGEYDVQIGFGWTNGMLLDLMCSLDCF